MEACASAHYWGRETEKLGHEVKLVPPIYLKPFVKRQKNDATDAKATSEAAQRPTMPPWQSRRKSSRPGECCSVHAICLCASGRRRSTHCGVHLAEFGVVAPQGPAHVGRLASEPDDPDSGLPNQVRELGRLLLEQITGLGEKIVGLEKELRVSARQDEEAARLWFNWSLRCRGPALTKFASYKAG